MTIRSLIGAASRPMNRDESTIMIKAMLSDDLQKPFDASFAAELGFPGQVLFRRMEVCTKAKIDKGLALMIVIMANGNPGNLVMWAYTMHKMNKGTLININDFAENFPLGVPSEEGFCEVWDSQKDPVNGGNLIDDAANWN